MRLIGYSIESIWTQKKQIKYIDTKNQLADILTKGNFTRDEWNHLLSLFNISHFSSTVCSAAMAKRLQQESGEERVTAKSKPMMNLEEMLRNQDPWRSVVADDRSGQPDKLSSAGYSKLDYDRAWSPQEWKSEVTAQVWYNKFVLITKTLFSTEMRNP